MNKILAIPYRSQWDADANARSADCGATCCAMLAQWQGIYKPINEFPYQSNSNGLSTSEHLVQNLQMVGLSARTLMLDPIEPTPEGAICLNLYGAFDRDDVQDVNYTGWHWMILLNEGDEQVRVHDPDWWGDQRNRGAYHVYSRVNWNEAFIPYPGDSQKTCVVLEAT